MVTSAGQYVGLLPVGQHDRGGRSVGLYAGVNNILDNRTIVTTAYESGRLRNLGTSYLPSLAVHPTKYYRALGLNFFVNLSYRF